eukprot:m.442419 g.442419  ORF g.442419 m.442419 type:complete len:73 (+) comp56816_c0_seq8:4336-4554(+)
MPPLLQTQFRHPTFALARFERGLCCLSWGFRLVDEEAFSSESRLLSLVGLELPASNRIRANPHELDCSVNRP